MSKSNDNPDKTQDELEEEENLEEEEGTETEGDEDDEPSPGSDDEDPEEGSEDEEEGADDKEDDDEGDDDPDAKFKGKKVEDVIEMYKNLEKTLPRRIAGEAIKKAQEMLDKANGKRPEGKGKTEKEIEDELSKLDFKKMKPAEFAKWVLTQIDARAVRKAQEIYDQSSATKVTVQREIREATKSHPHLKENVEYREIVISLIEAAAAKGKTLTLKEACEKADKAMGIKPGEKKEEGKDGKDKDGKPIKKKKPGVESPSGTDADENEDEEEKIKKGILSGGKSTSVLGGLGI